MAEVVALPWVETKRLVALVGDDSSVALSATQAIVDLCVRAGIFTEADFYAAVNARLTDAAEAREGDA